jgi:glutathione S-transferase
MMEYSDPAALHLVCGNRNYSSWSLRAWLCLRRAGLDPQLTVLPMDTQEFEARIAGLSPSRRVPALWCGGECVWDSLAIAEFVSEVHAAGRLWPEGTFLRALGRAIAAEMHSGFAALREALPMNCRARGRRVAISRAVRRDIDRIVTIWDDARARSGSDDWLLGSWSIADAMYAPVVLRFRAYEVDLPESARAYCRRWLTDTDLQAWIEAAEQEPWVIEHEEVGEPPR